MNAPRSTEARGIVSFRVGGQWFGLPVLQVQDVINQTPLDCVPLAPEEVAGCLNLRGRIVTAIDMRRRLNLEPRKADETHMCVIVERSGELFALMVDDVGDVLWLSPDAYEPTPVTVPAAWRGISEGLYRLDDGLLLVVKIEDILALSSRETASTRTAAAAAAMTF